MDKEATVISNNLKELIRDFGLNDVSESKIATEIGIQKQLLNKILNSKSKMPSVNVCAKIYAWAKKYDSTINFDWLIGVSNQKHLETVTKLELSGNTMQTLQKIQDKNLIDDFNLLVSIDEFPQLIAYLKRLHNLIVYLEPSGYKYDENYFIYKVYSLLDLLVSKYIKKVRKLAREDPNIDYDKFLSTYRHDFFEDTSNTSKLFAFIDKANDCGKLDIEKLDTILSQINNDHPLTYNELNEMYHAYNFDNQNNNETKKDD